MWLQLFEAITPVFALAVAFAAFLMTRKQVAQQGKQIAAQFEDRKREQEDRKRDLPSRFGIWSARGSTGNDHHVEYVNASSQPFKSVVVALRIPELESPPNNPSLTRTHLPDLPPTGGAPVQHAELTDFLRRATAELPDGAPHHVPIEVFFTDAAGRAWHRSAGGALMEAPSDYGPIVLATRVTEQREMDQSTGS